ncbi:DUF6185 family protein [Sorangium sp. So ce429]
MSIPSIKPLPWWLRRILAPILLLILLGINSTLLRLHIQGYLTGPSFDGSGILNRHWERIIDQMPDRIEQNLEIDASVTHFKVSLTTLIPKDGWRREELTQSLGSKDAKRFIQAIFGRIDPDDRLWSRDFEQEAQLRMLPDHIVVKTTIEHNQNREYVTRHDIRSLTPIFRIRRSESFSSKIVRESFVLRLGEGLGGINTSMPIESVDGRTWRLASDAPERIPDGYLTFEPSRDVNRLIAIKSSSVAETIEKAERLIGQVIPYEILVMMAILLPVLGYLWLAQRWRPQLDGSVVERIVGSALVAITFGMSASLALGLSSAAGRVSEQLYPVFAELGFQDAGLALIFILAPATLVATRTARTRQRPILWRAVSALVVFAATLIFQTFPTASLAHLTLRRVAFAALSSGGLALLIWGITRLLKRDKRETVMHEFAAATFLVVAAADFKLFSRVRLGWIHDAFWLTATVVMGTWLIRCLIDRIVYTAGPRAEHHWNRLRSNPAFVLMIAVVAAPVGQLVENGFSGIGRSARHDALLMCFHLSRWIVLAGALGAVLWLRRNGKATTKLDVFTRGVIVLAAASVLFDADATILYVPVKFLCGWCLLHFLVVRADGWAHLEANLQSESTSGVADRDVGRSAGSAGNDTRRLSKPIGMILDLHAAERALGQLRDTLSKQVAESTIDVAEFNQKLETQYESLESMRDRVRRVLRAQLEMPREEVHAARGLDQDNPPVRDVLMSFGPFLGAWKNAVYGAGLSLALALPSIALGLRELFSVAPSSRLIVLAAAYRGLILVAQWTAIGFLLGALFPYVRGRGGLQKGFALFLGIAGPALIQVSVFSRDSAEIRGVLLWVAQAFVVCVLLGLLAFDYRLLRRGSHSDWRLLFQVHNIPSIGVAISAVAGALVTSLVAVVNDKTGTALLQLVKLMLPQLDGGQGGASGG